VETLLDVIEVAPGSCCALLLPDSGARISYDSLRAQMTEMAAALQKAGVGPGDRVAVALPGAAKIVIFFGRIHRRHCRAPEIRRIHTKSSSITWKTRRRAS
jgi:non-ribosomal peptide synthetase component E (peptide arylation enzyme)